VGALAVERAGKIYVGLPIWASGYAPKNAARGTGDKFRVLVVNATSGGKVEYTMDFPTKSLGRIALQGFLVPRTDRTHVRKFAASRERGSGARPGDDPAFAVRGRISRHA
jgi:hypothetical protein